MTCGNGNSITEIIHKLCAPADWWFAQSDWATVMREIATKVIIYEDDERLLVWCFWCCCVIDWMDLALQHTRISLYILSIFTSETSIGSSEQAILYFDWNCEFRKPLGGPSSRNRIYSFNLKYISTRFKSLTAAAPIQSVAPSKLFWELGACQRSFMTFFFLYLGKRDHSSGDEIHAA